MLACFHVLEGFFCLPNSLFILLLVYHSDEVYNMPSHKAKTEQNKTKTPSVSNYKKL